MHTMLSSSQYIHPDYLQPLPTTLDAKKSPLALLAQTCSSIGKDTSPAKPSILDGKNKDSKDSNGGRKTTSPSSKSSPAIGDDSKSNSASSDKREAGSPHSDSSKSSFRAPPPKDIPPLVPIDSQKSPGSGSPHTDSGGPSSSKSGERERDSPRSAHGSSQPPSTSSSASSNSRISLSCGNMLLEVSHQESAAANGKLPTTTLAPSHASPLSSLKSADSFSSMHPGFLPSSLGSYAGCYPGMLGHHMAAMEAAQAAASPLHPTAISAHSALGLSSAKSLASHAALNPYTYARVKTTSGATTLVPICRDPYCTNCQITMQNAQLTSACAAGCTQCTHEKSLVPTSLPQLVNSTIGTVPVLPLGGISTLAGSSLPLSSYSYPHAFSVLPGHHTLPYVCNWVAGSDYCGKRFNTSEELLQHLRTHTSSSESALAAASLSAYPGLAGYPSAAALAAAGCHSHYPGSISPNSLRQAYPRSLSPNTILAANRFHPYKSPLSGLPTPALPGAPGLSPYYSPYALYSQRLGAAVAP